MIRLNATALDITATSTTESILKLIGLIVLCAIIIAASYFVTRFVGRNQMSAGVNTNFKSLDIYRLSQNKYLQLIQIGTRYFVIAVCKDTVTTVAELSKEDIVHWKSEGTVIGFKDILNKAIGSKSSPNNDSATDNKKSEE